MIPDCTASCDHTIIIPFSRSVVQYVSCSAPYMWVRREALPAAKLRLSGGSAASTQYGPRDSGYGSELSGVPTI